MCQGVGHDDPVLCDWAPGKAEGHTEDRTGTLNTLVLTTDGVRTPESVSVLDLVYFSLGVELGRPLFLSGFLLSLHSVKPVHTLRL